MRQKQQMIQSVAVDPQAVQATFEGMNSSGSASTSTSSGGGESIALMGFLLGGALFYKMFNSQPVPTQISQHKNYRSK